jgi:hypothetical protein
LFQLLQPIWLWALAGLAVPVIIHLWNQQPGKTLRVGSIALVAAHAVTYKKRIRLAEILLLLLRCLLLACIATALAQPFWRSAASTSAKGWVLIGRQQLAPTYQHFKPTVDSLLQSGMEFHYFEEGFKKEKLAVALQQPADSNAMQPSYRRLVDLLNEQADPAIPVYLFTDNWLHNFTGPRSAVSLNLHWKTYTPDTLKSPVMMDTAALRVTVFNHRYSNDARYLKAALDAIQQYSKRNIVIKSVTATSEIPAQQDWLFWLSGDTSAVKGAKNIVQYAKGSPASNASYILPAAKNAFSAIDLYRSVIEKDSAKLLLDLYWKDGFGYPLLTTEQQQNATYYWLYTHIDPAWNELPWSDNFPQLLYELLYEKQKMPAAGNAVAIIDSAQLVPLLVPAKEAGLKPAIFTETKLEGFFWWLVFLLFFAERLLSFYHRKTSGNE